jgi:hypothetical protein
MRIVLGAIIFFSVVASAGAADCRRVTMPTGLAVVAHGGVKLKSSSLLSASRLSAVIDAMPMRRQEMRPQN